MAFKLVQELKFDKMDYKYDRRGDVLDVSFGPPAPAIALQVEDWLAIQVRINPPSLQGMTIVGFKKIFEKINGYAEKELPGRLKRLTKVEMSITYDDESDTLVYRWEEVGFSPRRLLRKLFSPERGYLRFLSHCRRVGPVRCPQRRRNSPCIMSTLRRPFPRRTS